ncbi:hypothetical protein [Streptomyces sp. CAU 1734]
MSTCRQCARSFVERPDDHSDGYCRICDEEAPTGYVPAYDYPQQYFTQIY